MTCDHEQDFAEFWAGIVCNPDGSLNVDQVKRELFDYHVCMQEWSKVYYELTDGQLSKPNTAALHIIDAVNEHFRRLYEQEGDALTSHVELPGSGRNETPHEDDQFAHLDEQHEVTLHIKDSEVVWGDFVSRAKLTLSAFGLTLVSADPFARTLKFSGRVRHLQSAFGVTLLNRAHPDGNAYLGHYGSVSIPSELSDVVEAVLGLDKRPAARSYHRKLDRKYIQKLAARASSYAFEKLLSHDYDEACERADEAEKAVLKKPPGTFSPLDLAKLYDFPAGDGHGQTIAILEMGGGYKTADMKTYFSELGLPVPNVSSVSVDHASNKPGGDADGEVMLDIEVAGAIAPKASIVVYFAPNTDQGFVDCINAVVHDTHHRPSILSISWGGPEDTWTPAAMAAMDKAFSAAAAAGITVLVAAGDDGSTDGETDGKQHADFPASSPNVTSCGGTKLVVSGTTLTETVWNELADGYGAGGGGISSVFKVPDYQSSVVPAGTTGRGVPDVSGVADPVTGYCVRVDGQDTVIGGTSAVAPLYAGLTARLNQIHGKRLGFLNPLIYKSAGAVRDITSGTNGSYAAGPGYDFATGLGVIDGAAFSAAVA